MGKATCEGPGDGGADESSEEHSEGEGLVGRTGSTSRGSGLGGRDEEGVGGFDVNSAPSQSSPTSNRSSS